MTDLERALLDLIRPLVADEVERALAERRHNDDPSPWLTPAEAAVLLRTSRGAINNLTAAGRLTRHHPDGSRKVLLARAEIEALVQPERP